MVQYLGVTSGKQPYIKLSELDFYQIKNNLRDFIQGSEVFKDYDFEGSAMSTLMDLLAYNSTLYGYYANMIANESFLDTAQKEDSVFSHAKPLAYLPTSHRGAVATITVTGSGTIDSEGSEAGIFQGGGLQWVPRFRYTIDGATDIEIYQGRKISRESLGNFASDFTHQKFEIDSQFVDTTTLRVFVDSGNGTEVEYVNVNDFADNIVGVTAGSNVYFLTTSSDGRYAVFFGDDYVANAPADNAEIKCDYFETAGTDGNGVITFTSAIDGISVTTTNVPGVGGANPESVESVRQNAPLFFQSQGRFVTANDFNSGIRQSNSGIAANVWGGEENDPPNYGRVYVSAVGSGGSLINESQKNDIVALMKEKACVTILPEFVDPIEIDILLTGNILWDGTRSPSNPSDIETLVRNYISGYAVNQFNYTFNYPQFSVGLNALDAGIIGDTISVFLQKRVDANTSSLFIPFRNEIFTGTSTATVRSTEPFNANVNGEIRTVDLFDDDGILKLSSGSSSIKEVGSVDYRTGRVQLNDIQNTQPFTLRVAAENNTVVGRGQLLLSTVPGNIEVNT